MADLELTIQNYRFTLQCPNGQEHHVLQLAKHVHDRLNKANPSGRPMDLRSLLTLAITMEHEILEMRKQATLLNEKVEAANAAHLIPESVICNDYNDITTQIEKIASFVEKS